MVIVQAPWHLQILSFGCNSNQQIPILIREVDLLNFLYQAVQCHCRQSITIANLTNTIRFHQHQTSIPNLVLAWLRHTQNRQVSRRRILAILQCVYGNRHYFWPCRRSLRGSGCSQACSGNGDKLLMVLFVILLECAWGSRPRLANCYPSGCLV